MSSCVDVDPSATEAIAKEAAPEPPGSAGLKGEYLLRGQGIAESAVSEPVHRNFHVGMIGTLQVSGTSAVITYYHPRSAVWNLGRMTRQDCALVPAPLAERFGAVYCQLETADASYRETLEFHYVMSADGNRAAFEGELQVWRRDVTPTGITVYEGIRTAPLNLEASR